MNQLAYHRRAGNGSVDRIATFAQLQTSASRRLIFAAVAPLALAGCDYQCENGFKIKKEYSTIFWNESWHGSEKDNVLDGAIRTSTWTYKDARVLHVRCFQASPTSKHISYDIRYSIEVPLLVRLVPEIERAGPIEFVVSVDGRAVGFIPTRIVAQKESIDFLANVEPDFIDKLEGAKKSVAIVPRQRNEKLDHIREFKVAKLAENIKLVKEACKSIHDEERPAAEDPKPEVKQASR